MAMAMAMKGEGERERWGDGEMGRWRDEARGLLTVVLGTLGRLTDGWFARPPMPAASCVPAGQAVV